MSKRPTIAVIAVNHSGGQLLPNFFESVSSGVKDDFDAEIFIVDNVSNDDSLAWVKQEHPAVKVVRNDVDNYARGLNLGIANSRAEYVALVNCDAEFHPEWLQYLLEALRANERAGVVQGKILSWDRRRVNSAGVKETGKFRFIDIGFGEDDVGQYDEPGEIDFFAGAFALFRRACLREVGAFDEDFILFMENVDFSVRVRRAGWKMLYCPRSVVWQREPGTLSNGLRQYFRARNRLLYIAKHFPGMLPESIRTSDFYEKGEIDLLFRCLLQAMSKLVRHHGMSSLGAMVERMRAEIIAVFGLVGAHNFYSQLELLLGLRRLRVGIYDPALHLVGGGQKYVAFLAEAIQEKYHVTFIANKDVTLESCMEWYNLDLSRCRLRIVKIPFYERRGLDYIDESLVVGEKENPFDIISLESLRYDVFINSNMLGKVQPLSPLSIFICHFPHVEIERFFAVDQYDYIVNNSRYGACWTKKSWRLDPTHLIYPPVDMGDPGSDPNKKERLILSVARFEVGGSKKQLEMAKAFVELAADNRNVRRTWKLVLVGGSSVPNPYLHKVAELARRTKCNIELKTNLTYAQIKALYKVASIFWHACGLEETDPKRVEHFGMTTVEAMQNYCVPIVINGGGQKEIIEPGINGFTFDTVEELKAHTLAVINDEKLRREIAEKACLKSAEFSVERFKTAVASLFSEIENTLMGPDTLEAPSTATIYPTRLAIS